MHRFIDPDIPIVGVYNNLETFYPFLSRAHDPQILNRRRYHGDRGLFWLGRRKLLITTLPVAISDSFCGLWGYCDTRFLSPRKPSVHLSVDILNDPCLLAALVEYAGPARTLQLIPYATTIQFLKLAQDLRERFGLTVLLPESPAPDKLWLRDYVDTKTGFRSLAGQWLPALAAGGSMLRLPEGMVCQDQATAAGAAGWFASRGKACIVKADRGESGLGQLILDRETASRVTNLLRKDDFLDSDLIVVEEYIHSTGLFSPSIEFFVPPTGLGDPEITHLASQLFYDRTQFCGALISQEFNPTPWYSQLADCGLLFARRLQEMGYVGHFDLDTLVDDQGQLYLLEINARRTGTTFVHEFGQLALGSHYLDHSVLLSNTLSSGPIEDTEELFLVLDDMLYDGGPSSQGVLISNPSTLSFHEFSCIFVAPTSGEALLMQREVETRIEHTHAGRSHAGARKRGD